MHNGAMMTPSTTARIMGLPTTVLLTASTMTSLEACDVAEQHPTGSNTSDDIALITRAQNGDTAAFGTLIRDAHGRMWAVCLSITGNHQDAEDAMQNALTAIWRNIGSFEPRARFSTWAYRIASNAALQLIGPAVTPPMPRQASRNPTGIRLSTTASPPG